MGVESIRPLSHLNYMVRLTGDKAIEHTLLRNTDTTPLLERLPAMSSASFRYDRDSDKFSEESQSRKGSVAASDLRSDRWSVTDRSSRLAKLKEKQRRSKNKWIKGRDDQRKKVKVKVVKVVKVMI